MKRRSNSRLRHWFKPIARRPLLFGSLLLIVFIIAGLVVWRSLASGSKQAINSSSGNVQCPAVLLNDTTAATGRAVKFQAGSCSNTAFFGIAEPPWYAYENGGNGAYLQRLDLLNQLKSRWLRIDFPQSRLGNSEMNDIYNGALSKGIKILALAASGYPSDAAGWVRQVLSLYPKISAIEMGNECNFGNGCGDPATYGTSLVGAFDAKQAINSSIPMITTGLGDQGNGSAQTWSNNFFHSSAVQNYKKAHGRFPWDGIGYHPYADWTPAVVNGQVNPGSGLDRMLQTRNQATAMGDPGILWNTEFGYSTTSGQASANLTTAAQWLKDFGNWWKVQSYTRGFFYFDLDTPTSQSGRELGFGLLNADSGNPAASAKRPTFFTYQALSP